MGFFDKIREGIRKTRESISGQISLMVNSFTKIDEELFEELEELTLGGLRRAVVDGDIKTGSVMAGQIAGLVKEQRSCREIILEIMEQGERLLGNRDV